MSSLDERLPDGGPRYVETPATIPPLGAAVAEPFNAASAFLFVILAIVFGYRVVQRLPRSRFMLVAISGLLVGGIGGVLYHATRSSPLWFWLDAGPITLLVAALSIYLWLKLKLARRHIVWIVVLAAVVQTGALMLLPTQIGISVSYAGLAAALAFPLVVTLRRARGANGWLVAAGILAFGVALSFRILDARGGLPALPMGTHWLWHVFGAVATLAVTEFAFRLELCADRRAPS